MAKEQAPGIEVDDMMLDEPNGSYLKATAKKALEPLNLSSEESAVQSKEKASEKKEPAASGKTEEIKPKRHYKKRNSNAASEATESTGSGTNYKTFTVYLDEETEEFLKYYGMVFPGQVSNYVRALIMADKNKDEILKLGKMIEESKKKLNRN